MLSYDDRKEVFMEVYEFCCWLKKQNVEFPNSPMYAWHMYGDYMRKKAEKDLSVREDSVK